MPRSNGTAEQMTCTGQLAHPYIKYDKKNRGSWLERWVILSSDRFVKLIIIFGLIIYRFSVLMRM